LKLLHHDDCHSDTNLSSSSTLSQEESLSLRYPALKDAAALSLRYEDAAALLKARTQQDYNDKEREQERTLATYVRAACT